MRSHHKFPKAKSYFYVCERYLLRFAVKVAQSQLLLEISHRISVRTIFDINKETYKAFSL